MLLRAKRLLSARKIKVLLKKLLSYGSILIAITVSALGQSNLLPNPTPTPYSGRRETRLETIKRQDREHARLEQQTYANLYGQDAYANSPRYNGKWKARMVALYRKPRDKETSILKPKEQYRQQYKEILEEKNAGLIKLIPDRSCEGDGKIVKVSATCQKYNFPGVGSSYSFRVKNYRIRRLSDITLVKNSLIARGVLSGAIFVELGDIPLKDVNLKTPGLGFLAEYRPVKTAKDAMDAAKRLAKGVKKDGYIYGRGVFVTKNNTFAMRSIAYRGKYMRSELGVIYNELDFDKRRDVVVVFRILDVGDDGATTIVWKILRESKPPRLKIYRGTG